MHTFIYSKVSNTLIKFLTALFEAGEDWRRSRWRRSTEEEVLEIMDSSNEVFSASWTLARRSTEEEEEEQH